MYTKFLVLYLQKVWQSESVHRPGESMTYLAHGLIFSARPLLMQKPAPPVANQNLTDTWNETQTHQPAVRCVKKKTDVYHINPVTEGALKPGFKKIISSICRGNRNTCCYIIIYLSISCKLTDWSVTLDSLCSLYRVIQTGPAQVDVLAVVVGREHLQQAG